MLDKFKIISPEECPHVLVDMDEVMCDTLPPILAQLNAIDNTSITEDEIVNYDFTNFFNVTHDQIHDIFVNTNILETVAPFPGACEALRELKAMGYKIHIITARAWHPDGVKMTMEWLDKHGGVYDSVSVSYGGRQEKSEVYRTVASEFAYLVDDGMHNIFDACQSGIVREVAIMRAPWNKVFGTEFTWQDKMVDSMVDFTNRLKEGLKNGSN